MAGLFSGGFFRVFSPQTFAIEISRSSVLSFLARLLVGFGTRLGEWVHSGHGVCGISRLSPRSIIATATFMATGALTVFLINRVRRSPMNLLFTAFISGVILPLA